MSDTSKRFFEFMTEVIEDRYNKPDDFVKVVDVNEWQGRGGYCETCSYDTTFLDIFYVDKAGNSKKFTIETSMSELFGV